MEGSRSGRGPLFGPAHGPSPGTHSCLATNTCQGGVGRCDDSMSCLYFTVSDLLGQICVIRDKSRDRSCPVYWAANIKLVPRTF